MKTTSLLLSIILLNFSSSVIAHDEIVHQYLIREAYKLLKMQFGFDIPVMQDRIGYDQTGVGPFNPGGLMVIGAFREDQEDIVWGYGSIHVPGTVTVSHFWNADGGDESKFCTNFCINPATNCYSNAYEKAKKFIYGGYELQIHYPGTGITEVYEAPNYLPEFYKNGRIFYKGYYNITGSFVRRNY